MKRFIITPHGIPEKIFNKHIVHKMGSILKLVYAGRLNFFKGVDIAVRAVLAADIPVALDVIGSEDEQGFQLKLRKLASHSHLNGKISFYPHISRYKLWKLFANYDAIIIPSRELEAFSLTAIEAQARGLPVIYGNGGGITDVLGDSGIMIRDNSPELLSRIIESIYKDSSILPKYRKLGYTNASKFRLKRQIDDLLTLSNHYVDNT